MLGAYLLPSQSTRVAGTVGLIELSSRMAQTVDNSIRLPGTGSLRIRTRSAVAKIGRRASAGAPRHARRRELNSQSTEKSCLRQWNECRAFVFVFARLAELAPEKTEAGGCWPPARGWDAWGDG